MSIVVDALQSRFRFDDDPPIVSVVAGLNGIRTCRLDFLLDFAVLVEVVISLKRL